MDPETLERRCPKLGGPVVFGYCRRAGDEAGAPCAKVLDCWWERFDVVAVMTAQVGAEGVERLRQTRPRPKVATLVDLITKARERIDKT